MQNVIKRKKEYIYKMTTLKQGKSKDTVTKRGKKPTLMIYKLINTGKE